MATFATINEVDETIRSGKYRRVFIAVRTAEVALNGPSDQPLSVQVDRPTARNFLLQLARDRRQWHLRVVEFHEATVGWCIELTPVYGPKPEERPYDVTGGIIAWESGELDEEGTVELFQHLIDTGIVWTLQGAYGRFAVRLIEKGLCHR